MILTTNVIGKSHNANQDFLIFGKKFGIVADGCSGCNYSEVGSRLFLQLYNLLPDKEKEKCFKSNIDKIISEIIAMLQSFEHSENIPDSTKYLISKNFLFTLLAVFETEDKYIVYTIGDGYIITKNVFGEVSYIHIDYDNQPPYILYNYFNDGDEEIIKFKTFEYSKAEFTGVGVASDGIAPIVEKYGTISEEKQKKV